MLVWKWHFCKHTFLSQESIALHGTIANPAARHLELRDFGAQPWETLPAHMMVRRLHRRFLNTSFVKYELLMHFMKLKCPNLVKMFQCSGYNIFLILDDWSSEVISAKKLANIWSQHLLSPLKSRFGELRWNEPNFSSGCCCASLGPVCALNVWLKPCDSLIRSSRCKATSNVWTCIALGAHFQPFKHPNRNSVLGSRAPLASLAHALKNWPCKMPLKPFQASFWSTLLSIFRWSGTSHIALRHCPTCTIIGT